MIKKLVRARTVDKLTQAGLETLAIVAYKQPITRAEVEALIRSLASSNGVTVVEFDLSP